MQYCSRCNGSGVDPVPGMECCRGSDWECGARGCTGPVPIQEPCRRCGGCGTVETLDKEQQ